MVNLHLGVVLERQSRSKRPSSSSLSTLDVTEQHWEEEEGRETAQSLKEKQVRMEQNVYRIWTYVTLLAILIGY